MVINVDISQMSSDQKTLWNMVEENVTKVAVNQVSNDCTKVMQQANSGHRQNELGTVTKRFMVFPFTCFL